MMTKPKLIVFLFLGFFFQEVSAQICTVEISDKLRRSFSEGEIKEFLSIEFEINNSKIKTTDTNDVEIVINREGFDTIRYSYVMRELRYEEVFICKLRADEVYVISPCVCCGIFLMVSSKNAKRGFVKFINNSMNEYLGIVSEYDYDTIPKNTITEYISSDISMNCGFRPNRIYISDLGYLDEKFNYENWSIKSIEEREILNQEQENHILYSFNYLFLHEERLIVTIGKSGNFNLKIEK